MQKMTFHVVSLPHTQTTKEYNSCAYTEKVRKFCTMMKSLGHTVYLYASEENEANVDELITVASKADQQKWFGNNDFHTKFFNITWGPEEEHWVTMNSRTVQEINKRKSKKDFICLIGGVCQKQIADAFPDMMSVEFGIGYRGVFSNYKVFESYAWSQFCYGINNNDNGSFYDTVIPNYFDPDDFPFSAEKDDYYLFMGRMIERKGANIAAEITERLGAKLLLAGQGVNDQFVDNEGKTHIVADEITIVGKNIEHVGYADVKKRGELMSRAKAVFVPTTYLEPFGGVSIEAMLCGTPVIATDFGVFPENVIHGKTGYRFRTLGEGVWAANNVDKLDPKVIRDYAVNNFGLERVKYLYQAYFEQLIELWGDGWYSKLDSGVSKYERYSRFEQ